MFNAAELEFAKAVSALANANPFQTEAVSRFEDRALKADVPNREESRVHFPERPRIGRIVSRASELLALVESREKSGLSNTELSLHALLVRFVLYFQFRNQLQESVEAGFAKAQATTADWFKSFESRFHQLSIVSDADDPLAGPAQVIACFFQIRRAYHLIQSQLLGTSQPIQNLRAAAWESVFTTDMEQYGRLLFDRMQDYSTLVVGPSGTGKELVARAVGLSRYIPFDARHCRFAEPFTGAFHAVNLSALSPSLIESELFGHAKGSFTGAAAAREGWLESCRAGHSVFLDEIGELEPTLQVKLLRVLQDRDFQRIGESKPRRFNGKVIAATNRNLVEEMARDRFRTDLYYRLCSDVIETPSLAAQLNSKPKDIELLVGALTARQVDARSHRSSSEHATTSTKTSRTTNGRATFVNSNNACAASCCVVITFR